MDRRLTLEELKNLIASHKKERDGRVRDRIKAVLLYDKGYNYSKIAEILLLDDETIRRHVQDYFSQHKLAPENGGSSYRSRFAPPRYLGALPASAFWGAASTHQRGPRPGAATKNSDRRRTRLNGGCVVAGEYSGNFTDLAEGVWGHDHLHHP